MTPALMGGILLFVLMSLSSCGRRPEIVEYPSFIYTPEVYNIDRVPVILVGRVLSSSYVGKPRPSRWAPQTLLRIGTVTVAVENVLQGSVAEHNLSIYYFVYATTHVGYSPIDHWTPGERDLFFLQADSGILRNICDNYKSCVVPVLTGAHLNWKSDAGQPIIENILHLLLSRGEGCSDLAMLDALEQSHRLSFTDPKQRDVVAAVEQVAVREAPAVQHGACQLLAYLGDRYSGHAYGDPLITSLRSACRSTLRE